MVTNDLKTMPPCGIHVNSFKSTEVDTPKRDSDFVFPCRTAEILQEVLPFSTTCVHYDLCENLGSPRPDPGVEARQAGVLWESRKKPPFSDTSELHLRPEKVRLCNPWQVKLITHVRLTMLASPNSDTGVWWCVEYAL